MKEFIIFLVTSWQFYLMLPIAILIVISFKKI